MSVREIEHARTAILQLIAARAPEATVCPSEVARAFAKAGTDAAASDWRAAMPLVHAAVDALVDERVIRLSWKGRLLTRRHGPYRIGRDQQS